MMNYPLNSREHRIVSVFVWSALAIGSTVVAVTTVGLLLSLFH